MEYVAIAWKIDGSQIDLESHSYKSYGDARSFLGSAHKSNGIVTTRKNFSELIRIIQEDNDEFIKAIQGK